MIFSFLAHFCKYSTSQRLVPFHNNTPTTIIINYLIAKSQQISATLYYTCNKVNMAKTFYGREEGSPHVDPRTRDSSLVTSRLNSKTPHRLAAPSSFQAWFVKCDFSSWILTGSKLELLSLTCSVKFKWMASLIQASVLSGIQWNKLIVDSILVMQLIDIYTHFMLFENVHIMSVNYCCYTGQNSLKSPKFFFFFFFYLYFLNNLYKPWIKRKNVIGHYLTDEYDNGHV